MTPDQPWPPEGTRVRVWASASSRSNADCYQVEGVLVDNERWPDHWLHFVEYTLDGRRRCSLYERHEIEVIDE